MADSTSLVQDGQNALTRPARLFQLAFIAAALLALYLISTVNFLLFHGIVELAGIAVAFSIFIILWNTRRVVTDGFFLILGISFLFFGSTMLIYLSSPNISKFIHFVTNKLRLMDISGIFLAVEKGLDPMLMTQLTTFVDTVIDTG